MATQLDVYRDWLEITETARPLNYYQLLKLKPFEDDVARVRAEYRKLNAHIRKFAAGDYAQQSQDLLNELAKAMLCLTDAVRKLEYDASLGRAAPQDTRRHTLEQILVGRKVLESAKLDDARRYAKTVGVDIRDALLQRKLAAPALIMQAYAESIGLPYVDLADVQLDESLIPKVPPVLARQHSLAPLLVDDGQLLVVSPNPLSPEIEEQLRLRFNMPVRSVLCTPAGINEVIGKYYPREAAAAQMASGAGAVRSTGASAKAAAGIPGRQATVQVVSAEERAASAKQRKMLAFVAFNFGLCTYSALNFVFNWNPKASTITNYAVAIGIGGVAAAITAVIHKLVKP